MRRRRGDGDEVAAVAEVERDGAEHLRHFRAAGRVVEQPSGEDEVEGPAVVALWDRAIGDFEVDFYALRRGAGGAGLGEHGGGDVNAEDGAGAPVEEGVGVEAGAAGEVEDAGVLDEGGEGLVDVGVFEEGDGGFADFVVGGLDGVVLG